MKKLGIFLLFLCFGCKMETDFTNTPTKKVEAYLSDIQAAKSEVLEDALNYEENLSSFSKEEYQKVEYIRLPKRRVRRGTLLRDYKLQRVEYIL